MVPTFLKNMKKHFLLILLPVIGLLVCLPGCSSDTETHTDTGTVPHTVLCQRVSSPAQPYDPATPAYAALSSGFAHLSEEAYDSARVAYQKATEIDSSDPAGYYGLAFAYTQLGEPLDAIYYYSRVIQLDSTYRKAYYNRAYEAMGLQQYMDAKKDLDRAIELDPYDPDAYINRGICKYSLGDEPGACKDWNRVCAELREGIVDVYYKESCGK